MYNYIKGGQKRGYLGSDEWIIVVGNTNGNLLGNEPYKNTVLKSYEGPKPWPSWLQKIDETVTRFTYRNFGWVFGMDITPSSIVPAMEPGRLIPMSEYGVYYSNTDQKIDQTLFLVSALSGAANLSATNNLISRSVPAEKVNHWFNKSLNYDPPYKEGQYDKIVNLFLDNGLLSEHGIIVIESDHDVSLPNLVFKQRRDYKYGDIKVAIIWR